MSDDADLRENFASLRIEDLRRVPSFTQVVGRSRPASRPDFRLAAGVLCLLAALVAGPALWQSRARAPASKGAATSLTDWRSPTDFLLSTAGLQTWRTVPVIGEPLPGDPGAFLHFNDTGPAPRAGREHS